uniref:TIR domain-containing protein n=1 Tax=Poecilia formosa TaxID=48698 RepID=A0A087XZ43_POEFO
VNLNLTVNKIAYVEQGSFIDLVLLETLDMGNNKLTSLTANMFEGLSNLTVLVLSRNKIQHIHESAFQCLTSLQTLDIAFIPLQDKLSKGSMQSMMQLRFLNLGYNFLTEVPGDIRSLSTLEILIMSANDMYGLKCDDFSNTTGLKELYLNINHITKLERCITENLVNLKVLDMSNNKLKEFGDSFKISLQKLEALDISHNPISSKFFLPLPNLQHLDLSMSKLRSLDFLVQANLSALRYLNLTDNEISVINETVFQSLPSLRFLALDNNPFSFCPRRAGKSGRLIIIKQSNKIKVLLDEIDLLEIILNMTSLTFPLVLNISLHYFVYSKINGGDFSGMSKLRILDLTSNQIAQVDEGSFIDLMFLQTLCMGNNKLNVLMSNMFQGLSNLTVLFLNNNGIQVIHATAFQFLTSLQTLDLGNNRLRQLTCEDFENTTQLRELYLKRNRISQVDYCVFLNLESLKLLDLSFNQLMTFENNIFLPKLEILNINHNEIAFLEILDFLGFQSLKQLDLAVNVFIEAPSIDMFWFNPDLKSVTFIETDFSDAGPELFLPIPNLHSLELSKCNISSLDFLVKANLTALRFLKLTDNELSVINDTVFKSFPSLTYLDLDNNPFTCNCSNARFIQWVKNNKQTQVVNAHQYKCSSSVDKGESLLLEYDVHLCWDDGRFFYFISSTCLVVLTLLTSFIYNFLWWHLTYTFHLFLAYFYDSQRRKKEVLHRFDAFVSYNVHDEGWVYREMLPVLEGEQGWRLCLHHRDFQPGKPIIENITDAIYGSRKTICVISRSYLQSEWCSREIQMASFRLFDEKKDVLVLLFLENIPARHLSPYYRMRKLVKRRTYLSWPQAAQHPEVFWQNVQRALQTG